MTTHGPQPPVNEPPPGTPPPASPSPPPTALGSPGPGTPRRRLLLVGSAAVVLVAALAAGIGILLWRLTDSSGLGPTDSLTVRLAPPSGAPAPSDGELDRAMELLEARALDVSATNEVDVRREGDTVVVGMEGVADPDRATDLIAARGELRFRPVLEAIPAEQLDELDPPGPDPQASEDDSNGGQDRAGECEPADPDTLAAPDPTELTPPDADHPCDVVVLEGNDGQRYVLGPTLATGEIIETAEADVDQVGNWIVSLLFRSGSEGIGKFNEAASLCFEAGPSCPTQTLAIVMDSQVQSAPMIQQPNFERDGVIITWSDATEQEVGDLALVLRHPALPIDLEVQSTG